MRYLYQIIIQKNWNHNFKKNPAGSAYRCSKISKLSMYNFNNKKKILIRSKPSLRILSVHLYNFLFNYLFFFNFCLVTKSILYLNRKNLWLKKCKIITKDYTLLKMINKKCGFIKILFACLLLLWFFCFEYISRCFLRICHYIIKH